MALMVTYIHNMWLVQKPSGGFQGLNQQDHKYKGDKIDDHS